VQAAIKTFSLFIIIQVIAWVMPQKPSAQVSVSFQNFYNDLSPYGNWLDNSDYEYVRIPRISRGSVPADRTAIGYSLITGGHGFLFIQWKISQKNPG
jgi:hypothetical protein